MERKPRIMLVDRRQISLERNQSCLRGAGYEVQPHQAPLGTAKAALRLKPDVLVLDLEMTPLSVDQVMAILRGRERSAFPILLLGDRERSGVLASEATRLGADGYVIRDDTGQALLAAIDRIIRARSGQKSVAVAPGRKRKAKKNEEADRDLPSSLEWGEPGEGL